MSGIRPENQDEVKRRRLGSRNRNKMENKEEEV